MNWRDSPLGTPEHWPEALKSTLGLLLTSRSQICLFWGEELIAFYNDAYRAAIGENHPRALGRPAREGWAALWGSLEPLLRGVQRTGRTYDREAMLFRQLRHGFLEDTFFDVSYNPIRTSDGRIEGVFCIVVDQTRRVLDERRLMILRDLSLRAGIETAADAARAFVSVLTEKRGPDVPYALVYLQNRQGRFRLEATHGGRPDPAIAEIPPGTEPAEDPRLQAVARVAAGGPVETLQAGFLIDPPSFANRLTVILPLLAGHDVVGVLVMAKNRHIAVDADARRFSELVAGQLSALLSTARVLAEERHRAQALEQQVTAALAEREIAEARLRQAQKMEAIGQLTGGVAHDFNNLLQVIGGNLHLLSRDVAGMPRAERRIANALAGVARGAKLSSQLLAFSRRQPLEPKVVRVERLIAGMDDMFRRSLGEAVEIETRVGAGLWSTMIDPTQLENALLNLAINARDAMDGRGRLSIDATNAILDDSYCHRHGDATPGHYVDVSVTDTGHGMSREIIEQVFEPFFSTKPEGKGTGLGLSMVYGFVHQSGGHIRIDSAPAQGTTIHLFLPRTMEHEPPLLEPEHTPVVAGGNETILVAEDNEGVRDTVVSMLVELGYRVLKAKDAASAMNVLESGVRIDLLFTDVVMPGEMRGPELAARARERIPGLAVLFTSGYTEDALLHGGKLEDGIDLLSKPYTAESLARKLRQVLSNRDQNGSDSAGVRRRLRVLLVEDDVLIRDTSAELLTSHGHVVAQASSAEAAIDLLRRDRFDVLATDLGLPGVGGAALARTALETDPSIGLVFATGDTAFEAELTGPFAGAVLLAKPYDEPALLAAIRRAINPLR